MKNIMTIICFFFIYVFASFITSCQPEDLTPISDFAENENVIIFQKHSLGEGIQIVLVADGYEDKTIPTLYQMYKYLFKVEPYPGLKDYFTVIGITKVDSLGITTVNDQYTGNTYHLSTKVQAAAGLKSLYNTAIVIAVSPDLPHKRSCTWLANNHHRESIALCAFANMKDEYRKYILAHEVGGHALGALEDEYVEIAKEIPDNKVASIERWQKKGMLLNVTFDKNLPEDWRQLQDAFGIDAVDLYEGGGLYKKGIYRSSNNSIMRNQYENFNIVSEYQIWKSVIEHKAGQTTNVQEFIAYKKQSRAAFSENYDSTSIIPDSLHGRVIRLTE